MAMPTRLSVLLQTRRSAWAALTTIGDKSMQRRAGTVVELRRRSGMASPFIPGADQIVFPLNFLPAENRVVNDNAAKVVDVGAGRPGHQQIPHPAEEPGGVVVLQESGGIEARRPRPGGRGGVRERPGRVGRGAGPAV